MCTSTGLAQREIHFRWDRVRKAMIKRVLAGLRRIVSVDDSLESRQWIECRAHPVVYLDGSVQYSSRTAKIIWTNAKGDPLLLAQETVDRSKQFETYCAGSTYRSYEIMLERLGE